MKTVVRSIPERTPDLPRLAEHRITQDRRKCFRILFSEHIVFLGEGV